MCAYNRVDGDYACESRALLSEVLKGEWHYPGFVMSDWGAVHSAAKAVNAGLDQESAPSLDDQFWFGAPLRQALAKGEVPSARIDDMARRILRSLFQVGLFEHPALRAAGPDAVAAHAQLTIACDPRLLARYDVAHRQWVIAPGRYRFYAAASAALAGAQHASLDLPGRAFGPE